MNSVFIFPPLMDAFSFPPTRISFPTLHYTDRAISQLSENRTEFDNPTSN